MSSHISLIAQVLTEIQFLSASCVWWLGLRNINILRIEEDNESSLLLSMICSSSSSSSYQSKCMSCVHGANFKWPWELETNETSLFWYGSGSIYSERLDAHH